MNKISCASRLKEAAAIRNMKQIDLCNKTGIKKSAMSQYFNGTFEPKQNNVFLLAQALDVSEAWLMGYDAPMERINNSINIDNLDNRTLRTIERIQNKPQLLDAFETIENLSDEEIQEVVDIVEILKKRKRD